MLAADGRAVDVLHDVVWRHRGKKIAPKTLNQKRYVDAIRRSTVTFGIGPAGTGKTYLAIALAVAALVDREVSRIILTRPAVEAGRAARVPAGRHRRPRSTRTCGRCSTRSYDMLDADRLQQYMEKGIVEVAPLAFMRGRTLNDSFIILDEAQNTTPEQMQMFLTRLGFGSKVVVTGDVTQIDLPRDQRSGLVDVREVLQGVPDIEFVLLRPPRTSSATSSCSASSTRTAATPSARGDERRLMAVEVDEPHVAARRRGRPLAARRRAACSTAAGRRRRRRGRGHASSTRSAMRGAERRAPREATRSTDVLSFPIDERDELPTRHAAPSSATS